MLEQRATRVTLVILVTLAILATLVTQVILATLVTQVIRATRVHQVLTGPPLDAGFSQHLIQTILERGLKMGILFIMKELSIIKYF